MDILQFYYTEVAVGQCMAVTFGLSPRRYRPTPPLNCADGKDGS